MKLVYRLNSENNNPLDKDFVSTSRKIKNKLLKDGFLTENDSIVFIPTSSESQIITIPE